MSTTFLPLGLLGCDPTAYFFQNYPVNFFSRFDVSHVEGSGTTDMGFIFKKMPYLKSVHRNIYLMRGFSYVS